MTKVGLLSDTHGYWDEKYLQYFEGCDEIWHAGDIGSLEVAQKLAAFRPFRAVYGKIELSSGQAGVFAQKDIQFVNQQADFGIALTKQRRE